MKALEIIAVLYAFAISLLVASPGGRKALRRFSNEMSNALVRVVRLDISKKPTREPYELYKTPPSIEAKWFDTELIGECGVCGGNDVPIVRNTLNGPGPECKWCAELSHLNYHLKYKGSGKAKSKSLANFDPSIIDKEYK